jgi:PPOX class probable F420-dependent enzyme
MQGAGLNQLANQKYLSLETFRKDGRAVATPVWFAEEGGVFYVYSLADAGKVKRIRNNPRVRIAPCDIRGKLKGSWIDAEARFLDASAARYAHKLLNKKYGLVKLMGNFFSKLTKKKRTTVAIHPAEQPSRT